ncbi:unnamed protein product [Moneuplotes crassus]|uniref:histone deacetylase n=1 Tax=Euplotes crassus TaxID=5936 RepID=A0AAD1UE57_EUPCR|nr:unnamed protein product [Moneuplotes crassus]
MSAEEYKDLQNFEEDKSCASTEISSVMEETKDPPTKPKKKVQKPQKVRRSNRIAEMKKKALQDKKIKELEMKAKLKVGYVFEEDLSLHKSHRVSHVERPERIWSIYLQLLKAGLIDNMYKVDGDLINDENILLCHSEEYLMKFNKVVGIDDDAQEPAPAKRNKNMYHFQFDTYENKWSNHCAKLSAGCVIETVDALYTDYIKSGFCIVRPPGHHAHGSSASGFCFLNNVAIAAKYAQSKYGVKKVCIFDWDVHFGDGTSSIFKSDPSVLFISTHRYEGGAFYPSSPLGGEDNVGTDEGEGFNINIPFNKEGMGNDEYIHVCENLVFPVIEKFEPELIFISAGFDSAEGDPLGGFSLTPAGYAYMCQRIMNLCQETSKPKMIAVLEGGYNLESISNSSEAVVRVLQGEKLPIESMNATQTVEQMRENAKPDTEALEVVERVKSNIGKFWDL